MNSCVTFYAAAARNAPKTDLRDVSASILADTDLIRAPGVDSDARFKPGVEHSTPAVRARSRCRLQSAAADPILRLRSTPLGSRRRALRARQRGKCVQNQREGIKIRLTF